MIKNVKKFFKQLFCNHEYKPCFFIGMGKYKKRCKKCNKVITEDRGLW